MSVESAEWLANDRDSSGSGSTSEWVYWIFKPSTDADLTRNPCLACGLPVRGSGRVQLGKYRSFFLPLTSVSAPKKSQRRCWTILTLNLFQYDVSELHKRVPAHALTSECATCPQWGSRRRLLGMALSTRPGNLSTWCVDGLCEEKYRPVLTDPFVRKF